MEQTLVYPAIHPTDKLPNDKLLECKGLVFNIANHSIKKKRKFECKELIIDIDLGAPGASEASRCPDKYCIYRVPKRLREVNNMAYTPRLVSIGPFHHRREELKDMDIQKFLILKKLCDRTGKSIEDLKRIIRPKEEEIRSCYSETFLLTSDGFLNMILLDAIFILELFYRKYEKDSRSSKAHDQIDYILSRPCLENGIQCDLLLLENQLPFFVLEELYQNWDPNKKEPTLIELSCGFFSDLIYQGSKPKSKKGAHVKQYFTYLAGRCCHLQPSKVQDPKMSFISSLVEYFYPGQQKPSSPEPKKEVKHLTDLVRYFFCPPYKEVESKSKCCTVTCKCTGCFPPHNQEQEDEYDPYYTATKLDEAGLKFTTPNSTTVPLIQIQFREKNRRCLENFPCFNLSWLLSCLPSLKSTCLGDMQRFLEVPRIVVDDKTEGLFRNLMALEQCHYPSETVICNYIVLLDDLITTEADVRLFVDNKIMVNNLGSNVAVMELFNKLGLEIATSRNDLYLNLYKGLNAYGESIWNRLVGTLTSVYFTDFFKGTATIAGIIVLVFTLWNFSKLLGKF
ncbi:hypothetical protein I3760_14G025000 [Carya illinoinensis]|nr:hypothetical protein I3760_14G025000 [Carya illinoinensis]KAG2669230.1 hypothetical protein I3760_14G025000 [Carya illinoinensis]KAG2669231.1 hypothetical protein I3760_14G025000 [Carya illinoinensis]